MEKSDLIQVKEYFGFTSMTTFKDEWSKLTAEEKDWFKAEVCKLNADLADLEM